MEVAPQLSFRGLLWNKVEIALPPVDNSLRVYCPHDYELHTYFGSSVWTDSDKNRDGRNRWYPQTHGNPETVTTPFKEDRVVMTSAWQQYYFQNMLLACYGTTENLSVEEVKALFQPWGSLLQGNRVITNGTGPTHNRSGSFYRDVIRGINDTEPFFKYMPLLMGGNVYRVTSFRKYNLGGKFNSCYEVITFDGSKNPPPVKEVNIFTHPWLFSYATICRYQEGLINPWSHVTPFPQFDPWNAHTILLNISQTGKNYVQDVRAVPWDKEIPNPYNPPLLKRQG